MAGLYASRNQCFDNGSEARSSKKAQGKGKVKLGGAFRAFVRLKTLGQKGRADFKKLGEQYRQETTLKTRDAKTAIAMAKAANMMKRYRGQAARALPTFGPNARQSRSSQMKALREAMWENTKDLDNEKHLMTISAQVLRKGMSFQDSLSLARSAMRSEREKSRIFYEQQMAALKSFEGTHGAAAVRDLVGTAPGFSAFNLRPQPAGPCVAIEVAAPDPKEVSEIVAWAHQCASSNLGACLERAWMDMHQLVQHDQCPPLPTDAAGPAKKTCYIAGVCLCSGDGPKTKQIAERLLAHMRQVFPLPNESGNRKRLLDGFIVLRVCGEPESYDYEDMLACEDCFADMWFHIGLHYLSPFRPTMLRVIEVDEVDGEAPREQGRRYVKVVGLG